MICYHPLIAQLVFLLAVGMIGRRIIQNAGPGRYVYFAYAVLIAAVLAAVYSAFVFFVWMGATGGYAQGEGSCGARRIAAAPDFYMLLIFPVFVCFVAWRTFSKTKRLD
jgi:hypothetical protein